MILLTVNPGTNRIQCEKIEMELKGALRAEGVQGGISVWPVLLATGKERLLLEYKSRQVVENPNHLAEVLAEATDYVCGLQVEAAVMKLDQTTTGLHITRK